MVMVDKEGAKNSHKEVAMKKSENCPLDNDLWTNIILNKERFLLVLTTNIQERNLSWSFLRVVRVLLSLLVKCVPQSFLFDSCGFQGFLLLGIFVKWDKSHNILQSCYSKKRKKKKEFCQARMLLRQMGSLFNVSASFREYQRKDLEQASRLNCKKSSRLLCCNKGLPKLLFD